jgi:tetratricopeptide (TPR) repeat protein
VNNDDGPVLESDGGDLEDLRKFAAGVDAGPTPVHTYLYAARDNAEENQQSLIRLRRYGNLLESLGRFEHAEAVYRKILACQNLALGQEHQETLASVCDLGEVLRMQGSYAEAEPLLRRALDTQERTLGKDHADTLASLGNLAMLLSVTERRDEAEQLYCRVLEVQERTLGRDHDATLQTVHELGLLLEAVGNLEEAERLYRWGLEACERALGQNHQTTCVFSDLLTNLLQVEAHNAMGNIVSDTIPTGIVTEAAPVVLGRRETDRTHRDVMAGVLPGSVLEDAIR